MAAKHEGRGLSIEAKNPREMRDKLAWHEIHAPCNAGTKCEFVDKDGDEVRGQNVTLEWEKFPSIAQAELF